MSSKARKQWQESSDLLTTGGAPNDPWHRNTKRSRVFKGGVHPPVLVRALAFFRFRREACQPVVAHLRWQNWESGQGPPGKGARVNRFKTNHR